MLLNVIYVYWHVNRKHCLVCKDVCYKLCNLKRKYFDTCVLNINYQLLYQAIECDMYMINGMQIENHMHEVHA